MRSRRYDIQRHLQRAVGATACMLAASNVLALDNSWSLAAPASGDWFNTANWILPTIPMSGDNATVNNGGTVSISGGTANPRSLLLSTGNLVVSGGTLSIVNNLTLATNWTVTQTSGFVNAGLTFNSTGTYSLSDGTLQVKGGTFTFAGGAVLNQSGWDPLESTCRHASLSIL